MIEFYTGYLYSTIRCILSVLFLIFKYQLTMELSLRCRHVIMNLYISVIMF